MKIPQNCKSPTQRQRFITTMKNEIEKGKKKKRLERLVEFYSANKIDNYNREGKKSCGGGAEKNPKNLQKSKHKNNNMFFLSHCCLSPFPCWESQSTSPLQDALQHCAELWICCRGSSDSNLILLLCFLPPMSTVIRTSVFSFVGALNDLLYISQTQCLPS